MQNTKTANQVTYSRIVLYFLVSFVFSIVILFFSLSFGGHFINPFSFFSQENAVFMSLRLPRVLADFMVGAGLSVVGCSFQTYFRNPLADPFILGIAGAAAVGVAVSLFAGVSGFVATQMLSLSFALATIFFVYWAAGGLNSLTANSLILVGVGLNFFFTSIITFFNSVFSESFTKDLLMWYLGSTVFLDINLVMISFFIVVIFSAILYMQSGKLNVYLLGEDFAINSGVNIRGFSLIIYVVGSLITSVIVAMCGAIGFVGIIIPHIVKIIFGLDHRINMILCFFLGGSFVVVIDTIFKTVFFPYEVPIGAVTAIIGTPFFIYILRRRI
jgi:iron complex transport system permease protein